MSEFDFVSQATKKSGLSFGDFTGLVVAYPPPVFSTVFEEKQKGLVHFVFVPDNRQEIPIRHFFQVLTLVSFPEFNGVLNAVLREFPENGTEILEKQSEAFDGVCAVAIVRELQIQAAGGFESAGGDCQVVFHALTIAGFQGCVKGGLPPLKLGGGSNQVINALFAVPVMLYTVGRSTQCRGEAELLPVVIERATEFVAMVECLQNAISIVAQRSVFHALTIAVFPQEAKGVNRPERHG